MMDVFLKKPNTIPSMCNSITIGIIEYVMIGIWIDFFQWISQILNFIQKKLTAIFLKQNW